MTDDQILATVANELANARNAALLGDAAQDAQSERNYDSEGRRLSWDYGKAKYYVDESMQESVGPATTNEGVKL